MRCTDLESTSDAKNAGRWITGFETHPALDIAERVRGTESELRGCVCRSCHISLCVCVCVCVRLLQWCMDANHSRNIRLD